MSVAVVWAGYFSFGDPGGKLMRSLEDALAQFALPLAGQQRDRDLGVDEIGMLRTLVGHDGPAGAQ